MNKELIADRFALSLHPLLYLPLDRMEIGRSPNLLSNGDMEAGTTGWSGNVASEITVKYAGSKSLKLISNTAYAKTAQSITANKYNGVTLTASGYAYGLSANTLPNVGVFARYNNGSDVWSTWGGGAICANDDAWHPVKTTLKVASNATLVGIAFSNANSGTSDANDIGYFDEAVLTVPQSMSKDGYGRVCHPEGCIWTPRGWYFDAVDDLLTFESDFIGTNALTVMGWLKLGTNYGASALGRIVDNGKFVLFVRGATQDIAVMSDGSTAAIAAAGSIQLGVWTHVAITRTAASPSRVNIYINGQLSGTANQSSGNPAAGTSNVVVGNRLAADRGYKGWINDMVIVPQVLSLQYIQRHYELTKGGYSL